MSAETDVVTAFLGGCGRPIAMDDRNIQKMGLVQLEDRLHQHSIEAAAGLLASECAVDAGVVNLWNTVRGLFDRQFFPLTSRVEHAQDVVEDRVGSQPNKADLRLD